MRHLLAAPLIPLALAAAPAEAAPEEVAALAEAMQLPGIVAIMQEEGMDYGLSIAEQLFPDAPLADWQQAVEAIYDAEEMTDILLANLGEVLEGEDIAAMTAFFEAEPGATIAGLEHSARAALRDEDVEQMAREAAAIAMADETPRHSQLTRFIEVNDLIEANVASGLNDSLNFMLGLSEGGGLPGMAEGDIFARVWSQEPEIRQNTQEWTYSFLTLAYEPLPDADLEAYIAFSETEPGQALNDGLFEAFDEMYNDMSRALGRAAARYMVGQQL
ncbi:hypothetical protein [Pseudoroseicyclus sp. CXY001]|uniref:hypothetical protein n=1 Tax=Pseudoroseicyclus sp. CXY001 TaxID=3242492 RepID=UPI00357167D1